MNHSRVAWGADAEADEVARSEGDELQALALMTAAKTTQLNVRLKPDTTAAGTDPTDATLELCGLDILTCKRGLGARYALDVLLV